jgi:hypothetical protein
MQATKTEPAAGKHRVQFIVPVGTTLHQAYLSSCRIYVSSIKHRAH